MLGVMSQPASRLASVSPLRGARRLAGPIRRGPAEAPPAIVVLGDLMLDTVLAPARALARGTDVTGRVQLRQGGSAANTARWIGRLGARCTLLTAVGRDEIGRALVRAVEADGVRVRASHVAGVPTGRVGVLVEADGQRSFVADRGAADRLAPADLRAEWFAGADLLHLPAYSLLGQPLGDAGLAAIALARAAGLRLSVDLASVEPLLAAGRPAALALIRRAAPDVLLATDDEARAILGSRRFDALLGLAPVAVVKRGRKGATVFARHDDGSTLRFEVATALVAAADTTGAGDAFDAGFFVGWLTGLRRGQSLAAALQRGAVAGNRAAGRHLGRPPAELDLR
jgi:sugar/nucleoside kinase (ribokinase family)